MRLAKLITRPGARNSRRYADERLGFALTPFGNGASNDTGMNWVRIIVSAWLAIAIVASPMFGAEWAKAQSAMSMTDAIHDCCPDPSESCPHGMIDCGSMAVCAMKCFGYAAVVVSPPPTPVAISDKITLPPVEHIPSGLSSLPFRPPRA